MASIPTDLALPRRRELVQLAREEEEVDLGDTTGRNRGSLATTRGTRESTRGIRVLIAFF